MKIKTEALHLGLSEGHWYSRLFRILYVYPILLYMIWPTISQVLEIPFSINLFAGEPWHDWFHIWLMSLGFYLLYRSDEIEDWENSTNLAASEKALEDRYR